MNAEASSPDLGGTPEPDGSDPKEVYAFAGLALYHAQLLEQEVQLFASALNISARTAVAQADVDAVFEQLSSRTLGQLVREARKWVQLPGGLANEIDAAVRVRNEVCHSFFADHSEDMLSDVGRLEMIAWLRRAVVVMSEADRDVTDLRKPLWGALGVTQEMAQAEFDAAVARAEARDREGRG
jgi:hypothetical protein